MNHATPHPAPRPLCAVFEPLLTLLSQGQLDADEAASVRDHVASCPFCQRRLHEYDRLRDAFRRLDESGAVAPPAFRPITLADVFAVAERDEPDEDDRATADLDFTLEEAPDAAAWRDTARAHPTLGRPRRRGSLAGLPAVAAALLLALMAAALFRSHGGVPSDGTLVPGLGTLAEFPLPAPARQPRFIVAGPDGNVWFTENGHLGRITPAGAITELALPGGATPSGLTAGPDGNLWFTDIAGARIGRLDPRGGAVSEFALPAGAVLAGPIVAGPEGALWFPLGKGPGTSGIEPASLKTVAIGRITPRGGVTEFRLPLPYVPADLTAGPDGNLWFTIWPAGQGEIGRMSPSGSLALFPTPDSNGVPVQIVVGPDGNLWFTEFDGDKIGRVTPRGVITEFAPPGGAYPGNLAAGPDGNLWFTDGNQLGRITTAGRITEFALPAGVGFDALITGPDGDLWGIETVTNRIVRIELARSG